MWSRSGKLVLLFNGEIFNWSELARTFHIEVDTKTDTQLLAELLDLLGVDAIQHLEGMFAFVAYRPECGTTIVARDPLGIKPLYTYSRGDTWIVSSEPRSIDQLIGPLPVDEVAKEQIATMRMMIDGHTPYKGIYSFPAGHYQVNSQVFRYYRLSVGDEPEPSDTDVADLIGAAVMQSGEAAVPIGAFLSGGVDSSLVAAIANTDYLWTVGTEVDNEFKEARYFAETRQGDLTECCVSTTDLIPRANDLVRKLAHPLLVPNEVLLAELSGLAQKTSPVLLSGEGADELFGGYDRIFRWSTQTSKFSIADFADLYCYSSEPDLDIVARALEPSLEYKDPAQVVKHFFLTRHLEGLLQRLDRATMSASVEARPALLSKDLVDVMAKVNLRHQVTRQSSKLQLRRVASKIVGNEIAYRQKIGFPVPLDKIFNVPGRQSYQEWSSHNWKHFESSRGN